MENGYNCGIKLQMAFIKPLHIFFFVEMCGAEGYSGLCCDRWTNIWQGERYRSRHQHLMQLIFFRMSTEFSSKLKIRGLDGTKDIWLLCSFIGHMMYEHFWCYRYLLLASCSLPPRRSAVEGTQLPGLHHFLWRAQQQMRMPTLECPPVMCSMVLTHVWRTGNINTSF